MVDILGFTPGARVRTTEAFRQHVEGVVYPCNLLLSTPDDTDLIVDISWSERQIYTTGVLRAFKPEHEAYKTPCWSVEFEDLSFWIPVEYLELDR